MSKRRAWNSTLPAPTKQMKRSAWGSKKSAAQKERDGARKEAEYARKNGSRERVYHIKFGMECIVPNCGRYPCENAHGKGEGMGRKGSYLTACPLCPTHHRLHRMSFHGLGSVEAFEERWLLHHGLTWDICAEATDRRHQIRGALFIEQNLEAFEQWRDAA